MKKIVSQVFMLLFAMMVGMSSVLITKVQADSMAGLNVPGSVDVGNNFNVSLILPGNAYAAQADITVKYSDGSTSSGKIVYYTGMADCPNNVTLNAKVTGAATVTASNIIISDSNAAVLESGGSKSGTVNITQPAPAQPAQPSQSTQPVATTNTTASNDTTVTFSDVNEKVYATSKCNVRESYSTSSNKLGTMQIGESLTRTGVSSSGWSRVSYNGKTAYISSQYLTTEEPKIEEITFKDENKKMYAVQNCNVRKSWSTTTEKIGYLELNQEVDVTGVSDTWIRIKYNNDVGYVSAKLLANERIEEELPPEEETEDELKTIQEKVGVIPEVGKNIANTYTYIVFGISLVCGSYFILKSYKEEN